MTSTSVALKTPASSPVADRKRRDTTVLILVMAGWALFALSTLR